MTRFVIPPSQWLIFASVISICFCCKEKNDQADHNDHNLRRGSTTFSAILHSPEKHDHKNITKSSRVSSHEPSQNSLTFPWHFHDHFVVFPDHETYHRHFITALTLILQAIWQITHQKWPLRNDINWADDQNTKFDALNFHKIVHSDNLQNWIHWRDKLFCDSWLILTT